MVESQDTQKSHHPRAWDVKVILGDATVHEDGSAVFEVPPAGGKASKFVLTAEPVLDPRAKRNWSRAYVTLTRGRDSRGRSNEIVNWISNSSEPCMIPPRYGGSTRSKLIAMHEKGHQKVKLSRAELDKLCAWIDLVVPFCGDYVEANAWTQRERQVARERIELRKKMDALELRAIRELAGG